MNRRQFLQNTLAAGSLVTAAPGVIDLHAAEASKAAPSFLKSKPRMKLGTVTYNLADKWDVETIIKNCEAAGFEGVELRTTHAHKVEVDLNESQRAEVKKRFRDSKVELMGLGSAFDYHTPDAEKLRKDMEATKAYMQLAHDVGATGVKVRPNGLPKEVPVEKTLRQIGESLRVLGEFGTGLGVQIRLEVHGSGTSLLPHIKTILDVARHPNVGITWNSNQTDLEGAGWDANFDLVKDHIFCVHMRDLYLEEYPFRKLLTRLNEMGYGGYCLAEIPSSGDPVRLMRYYRALWLSYQNLL